MFFSSHFSLFSHWHLVSLLVAQHYPNCLTHHQTFLPCPKDRQKLPHHSRSAPRLLQPHLVETCQFCRLWTIRDAFHTLTSAKKSVKYQQNYNFVEFSLYLKALIADFPTTLLPSLSNAPIGGGQRARSLPPPNASTRKCRPLPMSGAEGT